MNRELAVKEIKYHKEDGRVATPGNTTFVTLLSS